MGFPPEQIKAFHTECFIVIHSETISMVSSPWSLPKHKDPMASETDRQTDRQTEIKTSIPVSAGYCYFPLISLSFSPPAALLISSLSSGPPIAHPTLPYPTPCTYLDGNKSHPTASSKVKANTVFKNFINTLFGQKSNWFCLKLNMCTCCDSLVNCSWLVVRGNSG